jgi:hypothetical protein
MHGKLQSSAILSPEKSHDINLNGGWFITSVGLGSGEEKTLPFLGTESLARWV